MSSDMIPEAKEIGRKPSEASPNRTGGLGGGRSECRGGAPYKKIFGLQRSLDSLKINSNFINCGYEARQKS